ncbi:methylmalonyl Co-A mutase-associated GTPase MeaB [Belliella kenyensis]|uniref:Methylmalonyl Co-A mutase-associated GTPase MeaB n=1 Tax=Belliella kenyensis TaxID=1472724 RepID=A0ABV8EHU2_9BACT|nr:methylmalonyl Co-A mutase-associated GTPase MeaB [Belliella kenyensis]MCH7403450.1 methylmalonyl Co-A mutase-associated GTPase MeaB [Belliella kenyensis]MDN3602350.1 methylmalonyl Co-A mutase-associated GTPase MeaB [Belliella kenyensis]
MKRRQRLSVGAYVEGVLKGDRVILSQAITLMESSLESDQLLGDEVMDAVLSHTGNSMRIGITGVPGVGKSTFIEQFGLLLIDKGYKVAVLAIDPSSQSSRGSILGDKTRMELLSMDPRAYIRPSPAGNTLGGVSAKTREGMLLCEAAGFDVILIETVGVGQSEIAVSGMVDFFLLLMLAGAGDELQGIKKGIIEMCDALVVNKADGENVDEAKKAKRVYSNALHLFPQKESGWSPKVLTCSGLSGDGLEKIWESVSQYKELVESNGYFERNRAKQRLNWMNEHVKYLLETVFYKNDQVQSLLEASFQDVKSGKMSAIKLARKLVNLFINQEIKDEK